MSWAGPEDVYLSTSLASYLDKKLLVLLRDSRKLSGTLRSFDQFVNAVLEGACERVIVGDLYYDIPLGLYVIRGENVVLIGELDMEKEELPQHMTRVSEPEIRQLYFKSNDVYNEQWQNAWIIPAFWQVLSFSLLCIICALWVPSQNSMRYAYYDDASEEFDKDDTLTLIKPSSLVSKDLRGPPETRLHEGNVGSNGDLEEEKTE